MDTMKPLAASLVSSILVLGVAPGCDPVETRRGSFTEDNNNERFVVSGLAEGDPVVRVTVPVDFEVGRSSSNDVPNPELSFGDATVVGSDTGFARMYVDVSNTGGTPLCFVHGETIEFLDANGAVLGTDSTFVDGAVAQSGGIVTSTCIIEGGDGFLTSITEDLDATAVARVRITIEANDAWKYGAPDAEVVANSVEATGDRELRVSLENVGSKPATLETSKVVLFDADGGFLDWEFALEATPETIAPGGAGVMDISLASVPGTPAEVVVHLDWEE